MNTCEEDPFSLKFLRGRGLVGGIEGVDETMAFLNYYLYQQILIDWQISLFFNQCACPDWKMDYKIKLIT